MNLNAQFLPGEISKIWVGKSNFHALELLFKIAAGSLAAAVSRIRRLSPIPFPHKVDREKQSTKDWHQNHSELCALRQSGEEQRQCQQGQRQQCHGGTGPNSERKENRGPVAIIERQSGQMYPDNAVQKYPDLALVIDRRQRDAGEEEKMAAKPCAEQNSDQNDAVCTPFRPIRYIPAAPDSKEMRYQIAMCLVFGQARSVFPPR